MCNDQERDLKVGMKEGALVFIDEVENGLNCGCICPHCQGVLIAKKGEKNSHHFAHHKIANCGQGAETALHLLGKEIIEAQSCVTLPNGEKLTQLANVELEKSRPGYIADIGAIIVDTGEEVDIEIKVTHGIDQNKQHKIERNGAQVFEIDLGHLIGTDLRRSTVITEVLTQAPRAWAQNIQTNETIEGNNMSDKHLVAGFKSVSGYSRNKQRDFEFNEIYILSEIAPSSSSNYNVHFKGGFAVDKMFLTPDVELFKRLESMTFPAWVELVPGRKIVRGKVVDFIADVRI